MVSNAPRGAARSGVESWTGRRVVGQDGAKLGKLEHVYLSRDTQQPTWGIVKGGPLGRTRRFVPIHEPPRTTRR